VDKPPPSDIAGLVAVSDNVIVGIGPELGKRLSKSM